MYKIVFFVFAVVCALALVQADDMEAEASAYAPVHAYGKYPGYYANPSYEFAYGFRAHDSPQYYKGYAGHAGYGYAGYGYPHYGYGHAAKGYHY